MIPPFIALSALRKLPWRWIFLALAALAAAAWIWAEIHAYGQRREDAGRAAVQGLWDADILRRIAAENARLAAYQTQVTEAENEAARNRSLLADIRRAPVPRLRCTTVQAVSSPVRDSPGAAVEPAGTGQLQEGSVTEFDPAPAVMTMADRADDVVEACRVAIAKWPK